MSAALAHAKSFEVVEAGRFCVFHVAALIAFHSLALNCPGRLQISASSESSCPVLLK